MKTAGAYGLRVALVIVAAYIGAIAGAMIYGGDSGLGWHDVNPYLLPATTVLAAGTPVTGLLLALAVIYSAVSVVRRWPLWSCSIVGLLFAAIAYALRAAWRT